MFSFSHSRKIYLSLAKIYPNYKGPKPKTQLLKNAKLESCAVAPQGNLFCSSMFSLGLRAIYLYFFLALAKIQMSHKRGGGNSIQLKKKRRFFHKLNSIFEVICFYSVQLIHNTEKKGYNGFAIVLE